MTELAADFAVDTIREYQAFFKDISNQPHALVAGPRTQYMWQNMSRILRTAMILRDGPISELPVRLDAAVGSLVFERKTVGKATVDEHFARRTMDAMIAVHRGVIVHERYKTMRPIDKHNWFSSGKVISSLLIALLEEEGRIDPSQPVTTYLPELTGSEWDTVPVLDVLDMATGLDSTEHDEPGDDGRTNPERGWFQWAASLGVYPDVKQLGLNAFEVLRRMRRLKPGQTAFEYNSINPWVLEMIVERVSGTPVPEYFSERVWRKIGAQADAYVGVTPDGYPMTWSMVSSSLRDLARFGLLFSPSWSAVSGEQVVSSGMLSAIQQGGDPAIFDQGHVGRETLEVLYDTGVKNSRQWDVVFTDGDIYKEGVGGQGLYVSPSRDLVLAWFCTGKNDELVMGRAIATSGLFG